MGYNIIVYNKEKESVITLFWKREFGMRKSGKKYNGIRHNRIRYYGIRYNISYTLFHFGLLYPIMLYQVPCTPEYIHVKGFGIYTYFSGF